MLLSKLLLPQAELSSRVEMNTACVESLLKKTVDFPDLREAGIIIALQPYTEKSGTENLLSPEQQSSPKKEKLDYRENTSEF